MSGLATAGGGVDAAAGGAGAAERGGAGPELRSAVPPDQTSGVGARVGGVLDAPECLEAWIRAVGLARRAVRIMAFRWDLPLLNGALHQACRRGVPVRILVSWHDHWFPDSQLPLLELARDGGLEVRCHRTSRLHAKWLLADSTLVLGSCDFREVNQQYLERSVRLELSGFLCVGEEAAFGALFRAGERFAGEADARAAWVPGPER